MTTKKDRRTNGYRTPQLTISPKALIEQQLFVNPIYNDWDDYRDGFRDWYKDFKLIKRIYGYPEEEKMLKRLAMNRKQQKLLERRRIRKLRAKNPELFRLRNGKLINPLDRRQIGIITAQQMLAR